MSLGLGLVVSLLALFCVTESISHFRERCTAETAEGLKVLEEAYKELAKEAELERNANIRKARSYDAYWAHERSKRQANTVKEDYNDEAAVGIFDDASSDSTSSTSDGTSESSDGTDSTTRGGTTPSTAVPQTPPPPPTEDPCPGAKIRQCFNNATSSARWKKSVYDYDFPRILTETGMDPFAHYAELLHKHLSNVSTCDPNFSDLNSVTEAQLYGMFSMLATKTPAPFCSLCHRITEELHEKVIKPLEYASGSGHAAIAQLIAHIPSPRTLCSAVAPGCHADYESKVAKTTPGTLCLECAVCSIGLNVVQHRVLLRKSLIDQVYDHLRRHLFDAVCSTLCCIAGPDDNSIPPPLLLDYQQCQAMGKKYFYRLIDAAKALLRPERFCALELGWCELNENPNALHCLRELCEEGLGTNPNMMWVCEQIPDRPVDADKFLNIAATKVEKTRQKRHDDFERRFLKQNEEWKKMKNEL